MNLLELRDPSSVLAAYLAHDGERELVLLALPGGFWLLDERHPSSPFSYDGRLLAAGLPSERVARETADRYLEAARREHRPLAPSLAQLDKPSRPR